MATIDELGFESFIKSNAVNRDDRLGRLLGGLFEGYLCHLFRGLVDVRGGNFGIAENKLFVKIKCAGKERCTEQKRQCQKQIFFQLCLLVICVLCM